MSIVTLAEVFDVYFKRTVFDNKLAKKIYSYQLAYVNSNREHLEFFGGNLLGVHVVRFKDSDVLRFYNDVLDVDFIELSEALKKVTNVNQDYIVSSDVFNLTIMYLLHKYMTSAVINDNHRSRAVYDVAILFFYRTIAALISHRFRYPADPKIAQMAYANLSNKYLIKKLGTWHKVMDYRANDLVRKDGLHYKNLVTFNNDLSIVYAINDSQSRIRDLVKNYYGEFKKVHASGSKVSVTSSVYTDIEGNEKIKEKTMSVESHVNYIRTILMDEHSFIKDDLVNIITKINTNSSSRIIKSVLRWLSNNYNNSKHSKEIDEFINILVIHSFYLISNNLTSVNIRDYPNILVGLKNLYLSSRSTDKELLRIRDLGSKLIMESQDTKISEPLTLATRTSILLYIMLRVLVGISGK
jgi:hypothetical protein